MAWWASTVITFYFFFFLIINVFGKHIPYLQIKILENDYFIFIKYQIHTSTVCRRYSLVVNVVCCIMHIFIVNRFDKLLLGNVSIQIESCLYMETKELLFNVLGSFFIINQVLIFCTMTHSLKLFVEIPIHVFSDW